MVEAGSQDHGNEGSDGSSARWGGAPVTGALELETSRNRRPADGKCYPSEKSSWKLVRWILNIWNGRAAGWRGEEGQRAQAL